MDGCSLPEGRALAPATKSRRVAKGQVAADTMATMPTDTLETFRVSLAELGVGVTETTPEGCAATVRETLEPPSIGVPLAPAAGSLPDSVATNPTAADLKAATTGVTSAVLGVADYGSVLLESDVAGTEPVSLYPERHVAVLRAADVVADMPAVFAELGPRIREGRGSVVFATGPSATADMGELVVGAHGPREVHVVLVHEDEQAVGDTENPADGDAEDSADDGTEDDR